MSSKSLSALVRIYQRKYGRRITEYLSYFQKLDSLDDAIRFACHGKDGKIHGHQHLVGKKKLERAAKALQRHAVQIEACDSFDELLHCVEDSTQNIHGFGVLAVYDTSLRLGAYLGLWPEVVYLHAGTKKGCKALGLKTSGGTVEMVKLPNAVRVLEPYQAEDFLCIFKDQFGEVDSEVKGCSQTRGTDEIERHRRRQQIFNDWSRMMDECADDIRSTVAIYGRQEDMLVKDRTGVLFAVGERHFILTAAHGLEDFARHKIPLYTAPTTPGGFPLPLDGRVMGSKAMDVAIMELSENIVGQLVPRRKFLRMTDVDISCETPKGFYVVIGYPNSPEYNKVDLTQHRVVTSPLQFGAVPYDGEPDTELGYDPVTHIVLKHIKQGLDERQETRHAPKMTGMSGCGMWRLARFDLGSSKSWMPEDRKLVGIETSCKHGSFVKGTWIVHVLRLIAENFPDCERAMLILL